MSDVNFEHYKAFYYVAKYQNITSAAHSLYLSQPSVSRAIANLEEELNCKLFIRSQKGATLTPAGERLYKHVSIACKHLFSAAQEVSLMRENAEIIRLAISDAAFDKSIVCKISAFHKLNPEVHLKIENMSTPETIEALHANTVDMAIVTTPCIFTYDLAITELDALNDIAVAGEAFSELKDKELTLAELNKYTLITLEEGRTTRAFLDRIFKNYGLVMSPDIELASISQVLPLVRSGLGIGFVPERIAENDLNEGKIFEVKIKEKIPPRSTCLLTNEEYELTDVMKSLIGQLADKNDE